MRVCAATAVFAIITGPTFEADGPGRLQQRQRALLRGQPRFQHRALTNALSQTVALPACSKCRVRSLRSPGGKAVREPRIEMELLSQVPIFDEALFHSSQSTRQSLLRGKMNVSLRTLALIANAQDVPFRSLCDIEEPERPAPAARKRATKGKS